jgi:hypothetical protein
MGYFFQFTGSLRKLPLKCAADMGMGVVLCDTQLIERAEPIGSAEPTMADEVQELEQESEPAPEFEPEPEPESWQYSQTDHHDQTILIVGGLSADIKSNPEDVGKFKDFRSENNVSSKIL